MHFLCQIWQILPLFTLHSKHFFHTCYYYHLCQTIILTHQILQRFHNILLLYHNIRQFSLSILSLSLQLYTLSQSISILIILYHFFLISHSFPHLLISHYSYLITLNSFLQLTKWNCILLHKLSQSTISLLFLQPYSFLIRLMMLTTHH